MKLHPRNFYFMHESEAFRTPGPSAVWTPLNAVELSNAKWEAARYRLYETTDVWIATKDSSSEIELVAVKRHDTWETIRPRNGIDIKSILAGC